MKRPSALPEFLPIEYRDFYDVPRIFVISCEGDARLLVDCEFDDAIDDYRDTYHVYRLRSGFSPPNGSWAALKNEAVEDLGTIPVSDVQFDATRRKSVRTSVFERFLSDVQ